MKKNLANLIVGAMLSVVSVAQAAPTTCTGAAVQADGLSTADVTFNGLKATDCYGVVAGAPTADTIGFTGFTEVATTPAGSTGKGTFGGADFTLSASVVDFLGDWSMTWTGGPITVDLVAVVQTANAFASYFFDNLVLSASPGSGQGQWLITWAFNESLDPLKSFSIFMASTTAGGGTGGGGGEPVPPGGGTSVPEPATMVLLAIALLGFGLARRQTPLRQR